MKLEKKNVNETNISRECEKQMWISTFVLANEHRLNLFIFVELWMKPVVSGFCFSAFFYLSIILCFSFVKYSMRCRDYRHRFRRHALKILSNQCEHWAPKSMSLKAISNAYNQINCFSNDYSTNNQRFLVENTRIFLSLIFHPINML